MFLLSRLYSFTLFFKISVSSCFSNSVKTEFISRKIFYFLCSAAYMFRDQKCLRRRQIIFSTIPCFTFSSTSCKMPARCKTLDMIIYFCMRFIHLLCDLLCSEQAFPLQSILKSPVGKIEKSLLFFLNRPIQGTSSIQKLLFFKLIPFRFYWQNRGQELSKCNPIFRKINTGN